MLPTLFQLHMVWRKGSFFASSCTDTDRTNIKHIPSYHFLSTGWSDRLEKKDFSGLSGESHCVPIACAARTTKTGIWFSIFQWTHNSHSLIMGDFRSPSSLVFFPVFLSVVLITFLPRSLEAKSPYTKHFGRMLLWSSKPKRSRSFSRVISWFRPSGVTGRQAIVRVIVLLRRYWPCGERWAGPSGSLSVLFLNLLFVCLDFLVNNFYSGEEISQKQDQKCQRQHKHLNTHTGGK